MGITIHYRGKLDELRRLDDLRLELSDIGTTMGWSCRTLDDDWRIPPNATLTHGSDGATIRGHLGLRGIILALGGNSESLAFLFDAGGNLRSVMNMILLSEGSLESANAWVSVKTQFASPDIHVWIIGLLKYLKKRYMTNLEVHDEGGFWETGDRQALEAKMRLINDKLTWLSETLSSPHLSNLSGLSVDAIASRIEALLREKSQTDRPTDVDDEAGRK